MESETNLPPSNTPGRVANIVQVRETGRVSNGGEPLGVEAEVSYHGSDGYAFI